MNNRIEEGSSVLSNRKQRADIISEEELHALKLAIATKESFPLDSDNAFLKTGEEWVGMEEALSRCYIAVFHHYQCERWEKEATCIFLLSPFIESQFQLWIAEENDLSKLASIDQAEEVRQ